MCMCFFLAKKSHRALNHRETRSKEFQGGTLLEEEMSLGSPETLTAAQQRKCSPRFLYVSHDIMPNVNAFHITILCDV